MSGADYATTICYYNGKEFFASQIAVAEYYCAIAVQCIANGISQSRPVILDFFFSLFLYCVRLIFQTNIILAEILAEAAFLQVELVNNQAARNSRGKNAILDCAMNNDGRFVGKIPSDELVKSMTDSIILHRGEMYSINLVGRSSFDNPRIIFKNSFMFTASDNLVALSAR